MRLARRSRAKRVEEVVRAARCARALVKIVAAIRLLEDDDVRRVFAHAAIIARKWGTRDKWN